MELYKAINEFRDINTDNENSDDEDGTKTAAKLRREQQLKNIESLLAKHGIDVNYVANDGYTPLYAAVEIGNVDVVKLLLAKHGIKVNQPTRDGKTPLHFAIMTDNIEVVILLLAHPDIDVNQSTRDVLYILTMTEKPEMMKLLLEKSDIDVNQPTMGHTPLYTAAEIGNTVALNLLLAHPRIDVNKPTSDGNTPTSDGKTPFDIAIINKNIDIINLFLTYNTQLKSKISLARKSKTYVLPDELWDLVSTYGNTPAKFHKKNQETLVSMSISDNINIKDFILDPSASAGGKSKKKLKKYKKYKKSKTVKKYYIKKRKI